MFYKYYGYKILKKTKQSKAKQNKTKQNKTKQTKQNTRLPSESVPKYSLFKHYTSDFHIIDYSGLHNANRHRRMCKIGHLKMKWNEIDLLFWYIFHMVFKEQIVYPTKCSSQRAVKN